MDALEPYKYQALDHQDDPFRLLQLLPGRGDDPIRCILSIESLKDQEDKYAALSYTWGERYPERLIKINGGKQNIRPNLFSFLHTFRNETDTNVLWIDAVCIDQSSVEERNHQVGIMGKIYRSAAKVYAWLGPATPESDEFFRPICQPPYGRGFLSDTRRLRRRLLWIVQLTYWTRIWIVQELILAKDVTILVGCDRLAWRRFMRLWQYMMSRNIGPSRDTPRSVEELIGRLIRSWELSADPRYNGRLISLLHNFTHMECIVPHDHIYALLGMVQEGPMVDVNYDMSLPMLILETLRKSRYPGTPSTLAFMRRLAQILRIEMGEIFQLCNFVTANTAMLSFSTSPLTGTTLSAQDCSSAGVGDSLILHEWRRDHERGALLAFSPGEFQHGDSVSLADHITFSDGQHYALGGMKLAFSLRPASASKEDTRIGVGFYAPVKGERHFNEQGLKKLSQRSELLDLRQLVEDNLDTVKQIWGYKSIKITVDAAVQFLRLLDTLEAVDAESYLEASYHNTSGLESGG